MYFLRLRVKLAGLENTLCNSSGVGGRSVNDFDLSLREPKYVPSDWNYLNIRVLLDVTELELKVDGHCALDKHDLPVFLMHLPFPEIQNSGRQSLYVLIYNGVTMNRNEYFLASAVHPNAVVVISEISKLLTCSQKE